MATLFFIQFLPFFVVLLVGFLGLTITNLLIWALSPKDASTIAIFGSKGSGKSTLWKQLRAEFLEGKYEPTFGAQKIPQFTIKYNGKKKIVKQSEDFSGSDDMVCRYGEIIEPGTFIYYLIDLTTVDKFKNETRARLTAISKVFEKKGIKGNTGLSLVASHFDEYHLSTGKNEDDARNEIVECLHLKNSKEFNIKDKILVADLTKREDIEQFYKQIMEG